MSMPITYELTVSVSSFSIARDKVTGFKTKVGTRDNTYLYKKQNVKSFLENAARDLPNKAHPSQSNSVVGSKKILTVSLLCHIK